jgi:ABC-type Fe3+ transport system permease subunit
MSDKLPGSDDGHGTPHSEHRVLDYATPQPPPASKGFEPAAAQLFGIIFGIVFVLLGILFVVAAVGDWNQAMSMANLANRARFKSDAVKSLVLGIIISSAAVWCFWRVRRSMRRQNRAP